MSYKLGRVMQLAGLLLLPVGIAGNVAEKLTLGESLGVASVGVAIFYVGMLVQGNKGR